MKIEKSKKEMRLEDMGVVGENRGREKKKGLCRSMSTYLESRSIAQSAGALART